MNFRTIASALVLSTCTFLAQAGTAFVSEAGGPLTVVANLGSESDEYALGTLDVPFSSVFVTLTSPGSFTEYATLSIPPGFGGAEGAANTYTLAVGSIVIGSISNFAVEVFSGTPAAAGAMPFGAYGAASTFSLSGAPAGDYFLRFTGNVNGVGGQYSAAINVSPVPEPSTYLIALLGLGVLAWRVRRTRVRLQAAGRGAMTRRSRHGSAIPAMSTRRPL